jgi:hypothetical protein
MKAIKRCDCPIRAKLIRDPYCPLKTGITGQFILLGKDGQTQYPVSHCIACGGRLMDAAGDNDQSFGDPSGSSACTCILSHAADPICSVKRDAKVGEYELVQKTPTGEVHFVVRHCPWCGRMLDSLRGTLFLDILPEEAARLNGLLKGVETVQDVIRLLGPADREWPVLPDDPVRREIYGWRQILRQLDYRGLASTAVLQVREFEGGKVEWGISAKPKKPSDG